MERSKIEFGASWKRETSPWKRPCFQGVLRSLASKIVFGATWKKRRLTIGAAPAAIDLENETANNR
jgi:hypothetical protein